MSETAECFQAPPDTAKSGAGFCSHFLPASTQPTVTSKAITIPVAEKANAYPKCSYIVPAATADMPPVSVCMPPSKPAAPACRSEGVA